MSKHDDEKPLVRCRRCGATMTPSDGGTASCDDCGHRQVFETCGTDALARYREHFGTGAPTASSKRKDAARPSYVYVGGLLSIAALFIITRHLHRRSIFDGLSSWIIGGGCGLVIVAAMVFLLKSPSDDR